MKRLDKQRGLSLIEALVSLAALSFGLLALAGAESNLRLGSDTARQRSEAMRLATAELDAARRFVSLEGTGATFDALASGADADAGRAFAPGTTNTHFRLERTVTGPDAAGLKSLQVTVAWDDRQADRPHSVRLDSLIAGIDPSMSGSLTLATTGTPLRNPLRRLAGVPLAIHDLGDGRSVYKPWPDRPVAWVFDNASGALTSRCTVAAGTSTAALAVTDLTECEPVAGLLVTGFVRFSTGDIADAGNPRSAALDLDMALSVSSRVAAPAECADDAPASTGEQTFVQFACAVYPARGESKLPTWSGELGVSPFGWHFGTSTDTYRLCRYSADQNGDGAIGNAEHPARYAGVDRHLLNQNFLVVRGSQTCPVDHPTGGMAELRAQDNTTAQLRP